MKKNVMLKIASVLMVAVLLTTCAISSTFAKYATSGSSTDTARVAGFGVKVNTDITDLFGNLYKELNVAPNVYSATDDLVAPGTSNSLTIKNFATGTPEVSVKVSTKVAIALTGWTLANGDTYCPIVFTVNGTEYYIDGTEITSIEGLQNKVASAAAKEQEYAAGTNLADVDDDTDNVTISWRWDYEKYADGKLDTTTDLNDTYLADEAAAGRASEVTVTVTTTIEQTDSKADKPTSSIN